VEKKLAKTVKRVQRKNPAATVEVWTEDEHRLGLKPVNRIIWVEKGMQPIAAVNWRFQWLWLVGFVHPANGETYWWIVPRLDTEIFTLVLEDFARHFGIGDEKQVVLTLDQASFHTSEELRVPRGINLLWMPPKSPELQPAERLWPLTDEPVANRTFDNLDELEDVVFERCRILLQQTELVRGLTHYHWWPRQ
jgi:DDE superfamily endonuclease